MIAAVLAHARCAPTWRVQELPQSHAPRDVPQSKALHTPVRTSPGSFEQLCGNRTPPKSLDFAELDSCKWEEIRSQESGVSEVPLAKALHLPLRNSPGSFEPSCGI